MTKKKEKEKILFPEQQQAFDVLMTGKNVFLSGEAGTGKSTVLNKFRKEVSKLGKKVVVVAPTGIAAINVSGSTIHRTFKALLILCWRIPGLYHQIYMRLMYL